jgi:hypothetical protein
MCLPFFNGPNLQPQLGEPLGQPQMIKPASRDEITAMLEHHLSHERVALRRFHALGRKQFQSQAAHRGLPFLDGLRLNEILSASLMAV